MEKVDDFIRSLSSERLIKVIIGEEELQQVFHIQEALLRSTSPVFSAALRNENLGRGERGVLKFPDDKFDAWKLLLYWMMKGTLPWQDLEVSKDTEQLVLVRSWVLGHKYDIPRFQDLIMLELLVNLDNDFVRPERAEEAAKGTSPDSKLRNLIALHVIIHTQDGDHKFEDFNEALSAIGFAAETFEILEESKVGPMRSSYTGDKDGNLRDEVWKEYMVGQGPAEHWINNGYVCKEAA